MQFSYNQPSGGFVGQVPSPRPSVPQHLQPFVDQAIVAIGQILNASAQQNPARQFLLMSAAGPAGNWATPVFEQLVTMTLECMEFFSVTMRIPPQTALQKAAMSVCTIMSLSLAKSNPAVMYQMEQMMGSQGLMDQIARTESEFQSIRSGIQQLRNGSLNRQQFQQPMMNSAPQQMQTFAQSMFQQNAPWQPTQVDTGSLAHHGNKFDAAMAATKQPETNQAYAGFGSSFGGFEMTSGFGATQTAVEQPKQTVQDAPKLTTVGFNEKKTRSSGLVAEAVVGKLHESTSQEEDRDMDTLELNESVAVIEETKPQSIEVVAVAAPVADGSKETPTMGTIFNSNTHRAVKTPDGSFAILERSESVNYEEHETEYFFRARDSISENRHHDFSKAAAEFHRLNEERSAELLVAEHEEKFGADVDFSFKEHEVVNIDMVVHTTGNEDSAILITGFAHASFNNVANNHSIHLRYVQVMREFFMEKASAAIVRMQKAETFDALIEEIKKARVVLTELQWAIVADGIKQKVNELLTIEIPINITIDSVYDDMPLLPAYVQKKFDAYMRIMVEKGLLEAVKVGFTYVPYHILSGSENSSIEFLFENEVDGEKVFDKNFGGVVGYAHEMVILNVMSSDFTLAYVGNCGLLLPSRHPELHATLLKLLENRMPGVSKIEFKTRDNKRFSAHLGMMTDKAVVLHWD